MGSHEGALACARAPYSTHVDYHPSASDSTPVSKVMTDPLRRITQELRLVDKSICVLFHESLSHWMANHRPLRVRPVTDKMIHQVVEFLERNRFLKKRVYPEPTCFVDIAFVA